MFGTIKDYLFKQKIPIVLLLALYICLGIFFYWFALDNMSPININNQSISININTQMAENTVTYTINRLDCFGTFYTRYIVKTSREEHVIDGQSYHLVLSPKDLNEEITTYRNIVVPEEVLSDSNKWKFQTRLEYRCNPFKRAVIDFPPISINTL